MRAWLYHGRGDVRLEQRPDPVASDGHAVLRVSRCALCGTDASEYTKGPIMLPPAPTILGHEFVGVVTDTPDPARLPVGARVVSGAGVSCGACRRCREGRTNLCESYSTLGLTRDGGLAEQALVPMRTLYAVPDGLPDDLAVLAQPLAVGLHAVHRADPRPDDVVVLVGAGAIGTFVLLGLLDVHAGPVVVVDVAEPSLASARSLGATAAVRPDEVADVVADLTGGRGADLVFETSGAPGALDRAVALLRRGGTLQAVGLPPGRQEIDVTRMVLAEVDVRSSVAHVSDVDMPRALRILDERRPTLPTVVVPFESALGEGLASLAEGRSRGKVVVTMDDPT